MYVMSLPCIYYLIVLFPSFLHIFPLSILPLLAPTLPQMDLYLTILARLAASVDLRQRNAHGEGAVHSACMATNLSAVAFLLQHNVSPNEFSSQSETPLHYAVRAGERVGRYEMVCVTR